MLSNQDPRPDPLPNSEIDTESFESFFFDKEVLDSLRDRENVSPENIKRATEVLEIFLAQGVVIDLDSIAEQDRIHGTNLRMRLAKFWLDLAHPFRLGVLESLVEEGWSAEELTFMYKNWLIPQYTSLKEHENRENEIVNTLRDMEKAGIIPSQDSDPHEHFADRKSIAEAIDNQVLVTFSPKAIVVDPDVLENGRFYFHPQLTKILADLDKEILENAPDLASAFRIGSGTRTLREQLVLRSLGYTAPPLSYYTNGRGVGLRFTSARAGDPHDAIGTLNNHLSKTDGFKQIDKLLRPRGTQISLEIVFDSNLINETEIARIYEIVGKLPRIRVADLTSYKKKGEKRMVPALIIVLEDK